MLVVKVELHSAVTGEVTEISKAIIYNDGTLPSSAKEHNYVCQWLDHKGPFAPEFQGGAIVLRYNRHQPVHRLVQAVLENMQAAPPDDELIALKFLRGEK